MENTHTGSNRRAFKIAIAYLIKLMLFGVSILSIWLINDQTVYYLNNFAGNEILLRVMICLADVMMSIILVVLAIAALMLRVNKNELN